MKVFSGLLITLLDWKFYYFQELWLMNLNERKLIKEYDFELFFERGHLIIPL